MVNSKRFLTPKKKGGLKKKSRRNVRGGMQPQGTPSPPIRVQRGPLPGRRVTSDPSTQSNSGLTPASNQHGNANYGLWDNFSRPSTGTSQGLQQGDSFSGFSQQQVQNAFPPSGIPGQPQQPLPGGLQQGNPFSFFSQQNASGGISGQPAPPSSANFDSFNPVVNFDPFSHNGISALSPQQFQNASPTGRIAQLPPPQSPQPLPGGQHVPLPTESPLKIKLKENIIDDEKQEIKKQFIAVDADFNGFLSKLEFDKFNLFIQKIQTDPESTSESLFNLILEDLRTLVNTKFNGNLTDDSALSAIEAFLRGENLSNNAFNLYLNILIREYKKEHPESSAPVSSPGGQTKDQTKAQELEVLSRKIDLKTNDDLILYLMELYPSKKQKPEITEDHFIKYFTYNPDMLSGEPSAQIPKETRTEELQNLIQEFTKVRPDFTTLDVPTLTEKVTKLFKVLDIDESGTLSRQEIKSIFQIGTTLPEPVKKYTIKEQNLAVPEYYRQKTEPVQQQNLIDIQNINTPEPSSSLIQKLQPEFTDYWKKLHLTQENKTVKDKKGSILKDKKGNELYQYLLVVDEQLKITLPDGKEWVQVEFKSEPKDILKPKLPLLYEAAVARILEALKKNPLELTHANSKKLTIYGDKQFENSSSTETYPYQGPEEFRKFLYTELNGKINHNTKISQNFGGFAYDNKDLLKALNLFADNKLTISTEDEGFRQFKKVIKYLLDSSNMTPGQAPTITPNTPDWKSFYDTFSRIIHLVIMYQIEYPVITLNEDTETPLSEAYTQLKQKLNMCEVGRSGGKVLNFYHSIAELRKLYLPNIPLTLAERANAFEHILWKSEEQNELQQRQMYQRHMLMMQQMYQQQQRSQSPGQQMSQPPGQQMGSQPQMYPQQIQQTNPISTTPAQAKEDTAPQGIQNIKAIYNDIEKNGDGSISKEEFKDKFRLIMSNPAMMDVIQGKTSTEGKSPTDPAEEIYNLIDVDKSGGITVGEFINFFYKPQIQKNLDLFVEAIITLYCSYRRYMSGKNTANYGNKFNRSLSSFAFGKIGKKYTPGVGSDRAQREETLTMEWENPEKFYKTLIRLMAGIFYPLVNGNGNLKGDAQVLIQTLFNKSGENDQKEAIGQLTQARLNYQRSDGKVNIFKDSQGTYLKELTQSLMTSVSKAFGLDPQDDSIFSNYLIPYVIASCNRLYKEKKVETFTIDGFYDEAISGIPPVGSYFFSDKKYYTWDTPQGKQADPTETKNRINFIIQKTTNEGLLARLLPDLKSVPASKVKEIYCNKIFKKGLYGLLGMDKNASSSGAPSSGAPPSGDTPSGGPTSWSVGDFEFKHFLDDQEDSLTGKGKTEKNKGAYTLDPKSPSHTLNREGGVCHMKTIGGSKKSKKRQLKQRAVPNLKKKQSSLKKEQNSKKTRSKKPTQKKQTPKKKQQKRKKEQKSSKQVKK